MNTKNNYADVIKSMVQGKIVSDTIKKHNEEQWRGELVARARKIMGVCFDAINEAKRAGIIHGSTHMNVHGDLASGDISKVHVWPNPSAYTGPNTEVKLEVDFVSDEVVLKRGSEEVARGVAEDVLPELLLLLRDAAIFSSRK